MVQVEKTAATSNLRVLCAWRYKLKILQKPVWTIVRKRNSVMLNMLQYFSSAENEMDF